MAKSGVVRLLHSSVSVALGNYSAMAITAATQLGYARWMSPSEIGQFAYAFAIASLVGALLEFGFNRAVINRMAVSRSPSATIGTAWTLVLFQFALFLMLALAFQTLPLVSLGLIKDPRTPPLTALLLLAMGFEKVGYMSAATSEVELRYGGISALSVTAALLGSLASIPIAVLTHSASAVCFRELVSALVFAGGGVILFRRDFSLKFDKSEARALTQYSTRMLVATSSDRLAQQLDAMVLGNFFSMSSLGVYSYAKRIVQLAANTVVPVIQRVFFSAYSQRDGVHGARDQTHSDLSAALLMIGLAVGTMICFFPNEIVQVLLGKSFSGSAVFVQYLAFLPLLNFLLENDRTLLIANGRFRHVVAVRYGQSLMALACFFCLARIGRLSLYSVAATMVLVEYLGVLSLKTIAGMPEMKWYGLPLKLLLPLALTAVVVSVDAATSSLMVRTMIAIAVLFTISWAGLTTVRGERGWVRGR